MLDNDVLHHGIKMKFLVFTNERDRKRRKIKEGLLLRVVSKTYLNYLNTSI